MDVSDTPVGAVDVGDEAVKAPPVVDEDDGDDDDDMGVDGGEGKAAGKKKKKKKKKGGTAAGPAEGAADATYAANYSETGGDGGDGGDAGGEGGGDDGGDDGGEGGGDSATKKKRDKKKAAAARKKAAAAEGGEGDSTVPIYSTQTAWSSIIQGIKPWGPYPRPGQGGKAQQQGGEWGLAVPVREQFPCGSDVPHGLEVEYAGDEGRQRVTSAEKRELERLHSISYDEIRTAAECHRQVRKHMQSVIKPGMLMTDMCEQLENLNRTLVQENGLKAGIAFPSAPPPPTGPPSRRRCQPLTPCVTARAVAQAQPVARSVRR